METGTNMTAAIITVEPKGQQLLTRFWEDGTLARKKARTTL